MSRTKDIATAIVVWPIALLFYGAIGFVIVSWVLAIMLAIYYAAT